MKTDLDELDEFLIKVANTKAGIRVKLVAIKKYIEKLTINEGRCKNNSNITLQGNSKKFK